VAQTETINARLRLTRDDDPARIEQDSAMVTGLLIILAVTAGVTALASAAASGMNLQAGNVFGARFEGWRAFGLLAVALVLMWWAARP
jgi:hypothetical protein